MEIGKQIKQKRLELGMTQEELANALKVGRTTVANWEQGRNYPDIQLIVNISDTMNIPLETMLRSESEIVQEIARDTNIRKKQSIKIVILSVIIIFLILVGTYGLYRIYEFQDIGDESQIINVEYDKGIISVEGDLPFYRSMIGMSTGSTEEPSVLDVSITTQIDLSMDNSETIEIDLHDFYEEEDIEAVKTINFVKAGEIYKTVTFD